MKILNDISSHQFLTIDIETVRIKKNSSELSEEWQSAWAHKNKNEGLIPLPDELAILWTNKASLYAEFSKVCAISLVYLNNGQLKCKSYAGFDEAKILDVFAQDLIMFSKKDYRLAGHASKFFDFPFLCKRYLANQMPIPGILDESDLKPWDRKQLCTNELYKALGGNGSSLQALCKMLNIPVSKVDLVGDEVGAVFYEGNILRIAEYCNLDTIAVFNVLRRFKGEPIFSFDEVVYVNSGEILEKDSIFERISRQKEITGALCEEIHGASLSMSAKDRKNLLSMLKASLNRDKDELNTAQETELFEFLLKPIKSSNK